MFPRRKLHNQENTYRALFISLCVQIVIRRKDTYFKNNEYIFPPITLCLCGFQGLLRIFVDSSGLSSCQTVTSMMPTCSATKHTKRQNQRREKSRLGLCLTTHEMMIVFRGGICLWHGLSLMRQETEFFCVKQLFSCRYRQENNYLCIR